MKKEHSNKENWEARSISSENNYKSVLFKRFPDSLNNHIHNFHKEIILENIPDQADLKVLDAGCGYGRNSLSLIERNKNCNVTGTDISENFVQQYKSNTGKPAFLGSIEGFPENVGKFDRIICVTVLMYVEKKNIDKAIQNLLSYLEKNGELILIEPLVSGKKFSNGFGILNLFRKKEKTTGGNCFSSNQLVNLIIKNGGTVLQEKRIPVTTIFIIPFYLLSLALGYILMGSVLKAVSKVDSVLSNFKLPSLYSSMVVRKNH